jgi:hypothetical protein
LAFGGNQHLHYEELLLFFVPFYFCEYVIHTGAVRQALEIDDFVRAVSECSARIVAVPPSVVTLKSIYALNGNRRLNPGEYSQLMSQLL